MKKIPPPTGIELDVTEAIRLFREVGCLANTAIRVAVEPALADGDRDDLQACIRLMKLLVDRIGWVADVGLRCLGEHGNFARAEDWMLAAD